jgi:hypothetical protein
MNDLRKIGSFFLEREKRDKIAVVVASFATLVIAFFLFFFNDSSWEKSTEQIGTVKIDGTIRRRHARTLSWENVKGDAKVYLRDILYAPPEAHAVVSLNNKKKFELEPDSMVEFDEYTMNTISVTLLSGQMKGDISGNLAGNLDREERLGFSPRSAYKLITFLPDISAFIFREQDLGERVTEHTLKRLVFDDVAPVPEIKLTQDSISNYNINLVYPRPESADSPRSVDGPTEKKNFTMLWTPLPFPGASYRIEIAQDAQFNNSIGNHISRSNQWATQLAKGVYYWKVTAMSGNDKITSAVGYFTVTGENSPVPTRKLSGRAGLFHH